MFRARLAHLALVAGLGLVSGCTSCYSFTLGAPGGGGLFSRLHHNTPAAPSCGPPATPGCGYSGSPAVDGPNLDGFGGAAGCPCGSGIGSGSLAEPIPTVTTAPHLVPAPVSPTVPYAP
jgi:hypothetical protein